MKADIWFDFDGTLVTVEKRFYQVYLQVCKELGLKILPLSKYWKSRCEGISTKNILSMTGSESAFNHFISRRSVLIEDPFFLDMDDLRPEALNVLNRLLSYKHNLYLLSGRKFKENLLSQMRNLSINKYFRAVYTVSPYGGWEEKAEVLRLHSGEKSFVVGDSTVDILAGKKAGFRTCAISGGMSTERRISETCPDYTIRELNEIFLFV